MAASYLFAYGGYNYTGRVVEVRSAISYRDHSQDVSGHDGRYLSENSVEMRRVELRGQMVRGESESLDDWLARKAALVNAHAPGPPKKLLLYGDRYVWACVTGDIEDVLQKARFWEYAISFTCGDPALYKEGAEETYTLPGTSGVAPYGGKWTGLPNLYFTVSGVGAGAQITVANSAAPSGTRPFVFRPTENGDYVAYGSREDPDTRETVVLVGGGDRTHRRRGAFLKLYPGVTNTLSVSTEGTVMVSDVSLSWRERSL